MFASQSNIFFLLISSQWFIAFILNSLLVILFFRIPLLTNKGWCHAAALGTILYGTLGIKAWLAVIIYLLLGSLVTKLGFKKKHKDGIAESRGGRRGPENVWGSSATGAFLALLTTLDFFNNEIILLGFSTSFIAKLADTFGSEIGKRWGRNTYLITSFEKVKAGTDGAISLEGTLATFLGAFIMTNVMYFLGYLTSLSYFIIALTSGFFATIMESFLGASAQKRYLFLTNEFVNSLQTTFAALLAISIAILYS